MTSTVALTISEVHTMRRKPKKERKPAVIIRLAERWGYRPGRVMTEVLEWAEVIVVAVGLAALIMTTVTVRMHVPTDSMWPTINGDPSGWKADSFFVDRITYYFRDPKPGDIVVFRHTEIVRVGSIIDGSPAETAGLVEGEIIRGLNASLVHTTELAETDLANLPDGTNLLLTTHEGGTYDLGPKPAGASTFEDLGIVIRAVSYTHLRAHET